jgi:hypothetical protein
LFFWGEEVEGAREGGMGMGESDAAVNLGEGFGNVP